MSTHLSLTTCEAALALEQFGGGPLLYGLNEITSRAVSKLAKYLHDQKLIERQPDVRAAKHFDFARYSQRHVIKNMPSLCSAGRGRKINQSWIDRFEAIAPR